MPRPVKCRKVEFFPESTYFYPDGKSSQDIVEVILKIEELEAMRLKDIENLTQEQAAEKMQVSRQTFQNIIDSARKKVAIALTQGKAISIKGGNYKTKSCMLRCSDCNNEYIIKTTQDRYVCPGCGGSNIKCITKGRLCQRMCEIEKK